MRNVTYRSYLEDPTVREAIEEEARQLRDDAITRYIVAPIGRGLRRAVEALRDTTRLALARVLSLS